MIFVIIYCLIIFFTLAIFSVGSAAGAEIDKEGEQKEKLKKLGF